MTEPQSITASRLDTKKVYLKDISFESPNSPTLFNIEKLEPDLDIQMSIKHGKVGDDGHYEVVLITTASATQQDKTLFLIEVQQAGVFKLDNIPDDKIEAILEVACPNILLPFVREEISSLVTKGGFPQLLINPVNFDALYRHKVEQQQAGAANNGDNSAHTDDNRTNDANASANS
jgi:preprotein translocase subunit SecB